MHSRVSNSFAFEEFKMSQEFRPLALAKSNEMLMGFGKQKKEALGNRESLRLNSAIFEIHGVGVNYNPYVGYGLPYSAGFLISRRLVMTSNAAVPTHEHAHVAIIRLPGFSGLSFRLSPNLFFFTSASKNFTICALTPNEKLESLNSVPVKGKFRLFQTATVKVFAPNVMKGTVKSINQDFFTFTCPGNLLPGIPIFNEKFKLQGLLILSDSLNREKKAVRIDSILQVLLDCRSLTLHPDLEEIIGKTSNMPSLPILKLRLGDTRDFYWPRPKSTNLYHYPQATSAWSPLQLKNISSLPGNFRFKANSRTVSLADSSFMIIGGTDPSSSQAVSEVLQVFPSSGFIHKRLSMQEPRASCSAVYRQGCVYVIGGSARQVTCERYSILADRWEPFANLSKSRENSSACLIMEEKFILVIGGEGISGKSLERYSFQFDKWEILSVNLPGYFVNSGLFVFERNKVAIFGGKASEMVLVIEFDEYVKESKNNVTEEVLRVFQVAVAEEKIVTWNMPMIVWNAGVVKFVNESLGSRPSVFEFLIKRLMPVEKISLGEFKNTSRAGGKIMNVARLLTPDYFDSYL